jgi:hypothetical protein
LWTETTLNYAISGNIKFASHHENVSHQPNVSNDLPQDDEGDSEAESVVEGDVDAID